jgi:phage terminase large subunit GpA-like protein
MDKAQRMLQQAFHYEKEFLKPSEIAEKYRVLTDGNVTGQFEWERSPFWRDVVDTLSPECPYTDIFVEKASQMGWTLAALANILLAIMHQYHGNALFMSNNDANVKRSMKGFIDDMIRESGISAKVGRPKDGDRKLKGSGDTTGEKKFNNGMNTLYTWSGQTVGELSSITPKYGLIDEFERYKANNQSGHPFALISARYKTYQGAHKNFVGSTPEVEGSSLIHPLFLQGDQNYFNIPCPECGEYIDLRFSIRLPNGDYAGLSYKRTNLGGLEDGSVHYICQKSGGSFTEKHKHDMYKEDSYARKNSGDKVCIWIPTHQQANKKYGSFQVSGLYAGFGLGSWDKIVSDWCDINPINAPKRIELLITFQNQTLGIPWKETVREIKSDGLMKNQRNYMPAIVPDKLSNEHGNGDIIMLVCAVDLNGLMDEKNPVNDDIRLNFTVTAYTESGDADFHTSYEIMHGAIGDFERARDARERIIKGGGRADKLTYRHGASNSVWTIFENEVLLRDWKTQSGKTMRIMLCGVDTGNYTVHANRFVAKHKNCIAIKGGRPDEFAKDGEAKPYVLKTEQPQLWKVDGNRLKDRVYESITTSWNEGSSKEQPLGHMNFPMSHDGLYTTESYFIEYEGEKREIVKNSKKQAIGWQWSKIHSESRQHYFDCRVYSEALVKIAMRIWCSEAKMEYTYKNFVNLMKLISKR